tara:strand:- start:3322 stop:3930 length:609 start_codon:yes stop_codon:yes gene_type:complete
MVYNKLKNLNLKNIIDVGAFVGDFSFSMSNVYPEAKIFMIEANPNCEKYLIAKHFPYKICCLSDKEKEVDFYLQDDVDICSGGSYYKEKTIHYNKNRKIKLKTETLDSLNLFPDEEISLLKLDTQGSELDILNGAPNLIKRCKYILIETSLYDYNEGAPLMENVFGYMENIGFSATKIIEQNSAGNIIFQIDFLFRNTNINI